MRRYTDYISKVESEQGIKIKKKLIVAIKAYNNSPASDTQNTDDEYNISLNYWLTQYERSLEPLKDGQLIVPHFSKYLPNRK